VKGAMTVPGSSPPQSSNNNNNKNNSSGNMSNDRRSTGAPRRSHTAPGRGSGNTENIHGATSGSGGNANSMQTLAGLRSNGIAHASQQVTLTCYIPPYRVGAVIGRRGATILHIQREAAKQSRGHSSAVRVSVMGSHATADQSNDTNANSNSSNDDAASIGSVDGWTPVVIRGDPCGVFAAAKLLVPLLSSNSGDENIVDVMDDVVLDIPVHRSRHAAIIGRKGLTIATLSADHNVRIMVPHRTSVNEDTSNKQIHIVQLEGDLEHVLDCCAHMLSIVCTNSHGVNASHSNSNAKPDATPDSRVTENNNATKPKKFIDSSFTVPANVILSLTRIRQIGKSTNTVIRRRKKHISNDITPPASDANKQQIMELTITGRSECVSKAVQQLDRIIATASTTKPSEAGNKQTQNDGTQVDSNIPGEIKNGTEPDSDQLQNGQEQANTQTEKEDIGTKNNKTPSDAGNAASTTYRKNTASFNNNKRRNTRGGAGRGSSSNNIHADAENPNSRPKNNFNNKRGGGPRNNKRGGGGDPTNNSRSESNTNHVTKKTFVDSPSTNVGAVTN